MTTDTEIAVALDAPDWNGKDLPYRPPAEPWTAPRLQLHRESASDIDPIDFEVLSNRFWSINEEHADTIQRVSGSPVVVHNYDFNTCISTEIGEAFLFAPYIQYFSGAAELVIKYTLENRGDSPGINPGDVFVCNDPLIAGSHQMDVSMYAPVFVDGRLFCWVFNSCHCRDLGGVEPGSFSVQAPNHYYEAPAMVAVKLVDGEGGIRTDVEDTLLRYSRIPHMLALELRSQIAGVARARTRIEELVQEYGAPVAKGVMHKLIDDTETAMREKLSALPDGTWREVSFCSGALPGDRSSHKLCLTLEKRGSELYFTNAGTDPEIGSINCGYGQLRAAIGAALAYMLAYDHRFCAGGVLRLVNIDAEVGTISAVSREGAVTSCHAPLLSIYMAAKVASKMIYPDPELRPTIMGNSGLSSCSWITFSGTDQWGAPFASVSLDHSAGGIGAFPFRDGIDQGGSTFWPKSEIPDCEAYEQLYPILYLYRRAALNGGHGKFRGGNGIVFGWVGHDTDHQLASTISMASTFSTQGGIYGGHFGETGTYYAVSASDVRDRIAARDAPGHPLELRELSGDARTLPAKSIGLSLGEHDVIESSVYGGGGYGDPLQRNPQAVADDVAAGAVRAEIARSVYAVALGEEGAVNASETASLRAAAYAKRLKRATAPARRHPGGETQQLVEIGESLAIGRTSDDALVTCCTACAGVLCDADENYKLAASTLDTSLHELDPSIYIDPATEVDDDVVYRMFLCPDCGVALENELTLRDEPPVWDIQLDTAKLVRRD
ncbi:hydantoinase B/oxoprolinase family protein [Conexibacter sp. CPCC 206217]|uniref:hydantoinase B/oxoprolinase family protein n=1 Tax=Conexibacter sp. CPCC 206217 TaxID=3064574 RepID=UPI00271B5131|nr:hydantoinase B/oxoprolinase family protein [Conexibacter sp. CPCC 206217]MDO8210101.1 hydantoinase B/oxoprolinase family protein [Conexibacter sp. CPCC 206217]